MHEAEYSMHGNEPRNQDLAGSLASHMPVVNMDGAGSDFSAPIMQGSRLPYFDCFFNANNTRERLSTFTSGRGWRAWLDLTSENLARSKLLSARGGHGPDVFVFVQLLLFNKLMK
jgi:hypothetical protein